MHAVLFSMLAAVTAAGGAAPPDNPVLAALVRKGVAAPDGSAVKLAAPTMADGLDAEAQAEILTQLAAPHTLPEFLDKSSSAPIALKVKTIHRGQATFRTVDLGFVAHGNWQTLISKKFTESAFKEKKGQANGHVVSQLGFLTAEEMEARGLEPRAKGGQQERYFYTTFMLFDMVEVSATRYALLGQTRSSIVLAARVDPRFAGDAQYPNQWRTVSRDATAKVAYGKPQPYAGAGFYVKVTRLAKPAEAIFVEYHSAFHEPQGWFDGGNTLRAKLPLIAQHEAKEFRGRLAKASQDDTAPKEE
ncbi:MAG: hypothetical protein ABSF26_02230 [Thermoguttaceae bacterium]|jgi:hypothetical protein